MKKLLKKETIRFFAADVDLIREFYPGGYGKPGINEVIREVLHSWVESNLRKKIDESLGPDRSNINRRTFRAGPALPDRE